MTLPVPERGDDCGPLSWRHEIAHPLGPPPGRRTPEQLIADAVLTYQLNSDHGPSFHSRFIELDRATIPVDHLADKLAKYARLYHHYQPAEDPDDPPEPLWTHSYAVFPSVIVVLAGQRRERLLQRRRTVLGLCRADPLLTATPEAESAICLLDDLTEPGPFAPIFTTPTDPETTTGWLIDDRDADPDDHEPRPGR
ncbi:replication-relaxation family protein [Conexibacter sp. CPCC 206217]|uniref:replication-relaxation family protein n=1 Tax=Conexibacter sp. CPCC 206217 TaxID=3064574 RepID=UPI0027183060|nr:replication-relaxation family protein [Conexibacter sp. CPCC 206217]MDO8209652.1 replication-relaxation family protein [Conexibacter sp. CPCC 206217]